MGHTLSFSYLVDVYGGDYHSRKNGDLYTFTIEPLELHIYYTFANDCLSEPGHYLQMISK